MIRRPPRSTRTDTLFPYTTLFRSLPRSVLQQGRDRSFVIAAQRIQIVTPPLVHPYPLIPIGRPVIDAARSEEHTSELQSLMRISYAVFCLKKKKSNISYTQYLIPHDNTHTYTYHQHFSYRVQ